MWVSDMIQVTSEPGSLLWLQFLLKDLEYAILNHVANSFFF